MCQQLYCWNIFKRETASWTKYIGGQLIDNWSVAVSIFEKHSVNLLEEAFYYNASMYIFYVLYISCYTFILFTDSYI